MDEQGKKLTAMQYKERAIRLITSRTRESILSENKDWFRLVKESGVDSAFLRVNGVERLQLWDSILLAYGSLYQTNPNQFLWLLFGYLAGHLAMLPLVSGIWYQVQQRSQEESQSEPDAEEMRSMKEFLIAFFLGNWGIYDDILWPHLVYLEEGMEGLKRLKQDIPFYLFSGFVLIDQGLHQKNPHLIEMGNAQLIDQEQVITLTPIFETFPKGMEFLGRIGLMFPKEFHETARLLQIDPLWPTSSPSYGPVVPRVPFLRDDCYKAFLLWVSNRRDGVKKKLAQRLPAEASYPLFPPSKPYPATSKL